MTNFEDIDMQVPATHTDPWEFYTWLREERPLFHDKHNDVYWVSRYDDVVTVSKDPKIFCSTEGNRATIPPDESMIHQDGEQHRKQRALVSSGFTPKHIRDLQDDIQRITTELVDRVIDKGECEIMGDLAALLPMRLIGNMLGYPIEDHDMLRSWTDRFVRGGCGMDYVDDEVNEAFASFAEYHENVVEARQENPGDDLLSIWLAAQIDGTKLTEEQLLWEHALLLVGGSETTRVAIGGGLLALMRHRDQWEWLMQNPDGIPNAVEEIVRWVCPFVGFLRHATCEVELQGQKLPAGTAVAMLYPAANRDPRRFERAGEFDIRREFPNKPLAFGYGAHFCLGAALARMEVRVMLEELLTRLPDIQLAPGGEVKMVSSSFIRGPESIPAVWAKAQAAE